ncbi:carboxypeptidase-like regulatory domain-containing protein [Geofilum sp. OHC36d9]|uniref:carboxypeptidase-like regulatory domain-containing protein n=1 Tax=Geofilum sp. OHC36d9 TaxID=3458413 RepID=UPI0040347E15
MAMHQWSEKLLELWNRFILRIFIFIGIFGGMGVCVNGQTAGTGFRFDNITVAQVMDSLTSRYQYHFAYDVNAINLDSLVFVSIPADNVSSWIESFFSDMGTDVSVSHKQVVIGKRSAVFNTDQVIRISGRVIGLGENRPLEMVNIGVEGAPIGTVSNTQGLFQLLLPVPLAGRDMIFSSLGFQSWRIKVPHSDTTLVVKLTESSIQLPEVRVLYKNPKVIMEKVVAHITTNYPGNNYLMTAFFRETIKQDSRYVDVSEAVLEIFKPSYQHDASEQVRFIHGRKGVVTGSRDLVHFKLVGGPYLFSQLDVVRNRNFLPNNNSVYKYTFNGVDHIFDRYVYRIGFKPIDSSGDLMYTGEFLIDSESFAVVSAHFELTPASVRKSRDYLIKRDARRFKTRPFYARYRVSYRPLNGQWVLSGVKGEVSMKVVDRSRRERTVFSTVSEMVVSDMMVWNGRRPFKNAETVGASDVLAEQLGAFDASFWENYNIILPNDDLRNVFRTP